MTQRKCYAIKHIKSAVDLIEPSFFGVGKSDGFVRYLKSNCNLLIICVNKMCALTPILRSLSLTQIIIYRENTIKNVFKPYYHGWLKINKPFECVIN